jgi:hypothetical protein
MTVSTKEHNHQDINQYRDFAEQCLRLARAAEAEQERQVLHEMAETWRRLAEEAGPEKF